MASSLLKQKSGRRTNTICFLEIQKSMAILKPLDEKRLLCPCRIAAFIPSITIIVFCKLSSFCLGRSLKISFTSLGILSFGLCWTTFSASAFFSQRICCWPMASSWPSPKSSNSCSPSKYGFASISSSSGLNSYSFSSKPLSYGMNFTSMKSFTA